MSTVLTPELRSSNPEEYLARKAASYKRDPAGFAKYFWRWGKPDSGLEKSPGPREWQEQIFRSIGVHLQNPKTHFTPLNIAVASGKGIGKSALIGMLVNWAMSTCVDCRCSISANTGKQMTTKLVPEVHKWSRMAINSHWWEILSQSISSRQKNHETTWTADFVTWSENNPEAFAGLHNRGKRILIVFDEASSIPDPIWDAAEGYKTDEYTEIISVAFGNPTLNTGAFRECFGKNAHRWQTYQIDSRKVEGTNKAQIENWIQDNGEDSDFVRIWVRGEFPRSGSFQFISSEAVQKCRQYKASGFEGLPKILSCDVARFGDDQSVIGMRQGRKFQILAKGRGWDLVQTSNKLIELIVSEMPDATVIDGDGFGAGVIDTLTHRGFGRKLVEFHGGGTPDHPEKYFNRRAEVWGAARDALNAGMEIPDLPELADQLTSIQYGYSNDQKIQLEKKESLKLRGLSSPDLGDVFAMSYAVTLLAASPEEKGFADSMLHPRHPWNSGMEGSWMR